MNPRRLRYRPCRPSRRPLRIAQARMPVAARWQSRPVRLPRRSSYNDYMKFARGGQALLALRGRGLRGGGAKSESNERNGDHSGKWKLQAVGYVGFGENDLPDGCFAE